MVTREWDQLLVCLHKIISAWAKYCIDRRNPHHSPKPHYNPICISNLKSYPSGSSGYFTRVISSSGWAFMNFIIIYPLLFLLLIYCVYLCQTPFNPCSTVIQQHICSCNKILIYFCNSWILGQCSLIYCKSHLFSNMELNFKLNKSDFHLVREIAFLYQFIRTVYCSA